MECTKVKYSSEKFAMLDIERIKNKKPRREKTPDHAYFCPHCGNWHLTSKIDNNLLKVNSLESQIFELKEENHKLTKSVNKEDRIVLKKDKQLTELKNRNSVLQKRVSDLQSKYNDLLGKYFTLLKLTESTKKD